MRCFFVILVLFISVFVTVPLDAACNKCFIFGVKSAAVWTPAQLPGLIAWYKADVGVFTDTSCSVAATNNTTVACWKDQSGNGYDCKQSTVGNRPTFLTAGLNSKQTVSFTASSATGCITATGVAFGTGTAASGFFIGAMTSNASNFGHGADYCGSQSGGCAASGDFVSIFRAGSGIQGVASDKGTVGTGTSAITYSTETRFGGIADGSNLTTYINNVAGTSVAVTNAAISGGCITVGAGANTGCSSTGSAANWWDGPISEIVITNTALSASDRANLDTYLVGRW